MTIRSIFEKIINDEPLNSSERYEFISWASKQDSQTDEAFTPVAQEAQEMQIVEIASTVADMLTSRGLIQQASDITRHAGLFQAGEFRVGNDNAPGDGFTGGRYGYPGFEYNGVEWFLAGVENDVLKTGFNISDGKLYAEEATISGTLTATAGFIGGWEITSSAIRKLSSNVGIVLDSVTPKIQVGDTAGNHILLDGANQRIRSSNFVTGAAGFNIASTTGDAEFNNITARGELKTFLFSSSNQMAVAGNIIVSKDAGKLGADVGSGDTTVNFGKALTVGDWIKIQGPDSTGTNNLEWMLIGSLVSGTTYNVTRNVDGSGANAWLKDTPFVVIGANGDSRIELVAGASGSIQLITQGATWNTQTVQASMSTVAGAITAGAGTVNINSSGVVISNAAPSFVLKDNAGNADKIYLNATATNIFEIRNISSGGSIEQRVLLTNGTYGIATLLQDPGNANVTQFSVDPNTTGGKISIGSSVVMWARKDGTETVFNDDSYDINYRIETAAHTHGFYIDAGAEYASFFGTTAGLLVIDNSASTITANGSLVVNPAGDLHNFIAYDSSAAILLKANASTEGVGVGGDAESNYKFKVTGSSKFTDGITWDGWQKMPDTWTRTGNHTFTVSGDVTATYRKGTKVRYKDGGAYEYGVIASSSHAAGTTTVTLITNTDYTMAAATITDKYLSYIENPDGFLHWFNYTPTYSGSGSMTYTSVTTNTGKWRVSGTTIQVIVSATGTTGGTASNNLRATSPVTEASANVIQPGNYTDVTTNLGFSFLSSGLINVRKADSSNFALGASKTMNANATFDF